VNEQGYRQGVIDLKVLVRARPESGCILKILRFLLELLDERDLRRYLVRSGVESRVLTGHERVGGGDRILTAAYVARSPFPAVLRGAGSQIHPSRSVNQR